MLRTFASGSRRVYSWAFALGLISLGLLFVPQLGLLNYYFSLALGIVAPVGAAVVAARLAAEGRELGMRTLLARVGLATAILATVPLLVVTAGALFVQNCDYVGGLAYYLLNPVLGCVYGAAVGTLLGVRGRRTLATVGALLWWLSAALWNLAIFYLHPPIFTYNPFLGFLNGAVYDDVIPITGTWMIYRLYTTVVAGLLLAVAWAARSRSPARAVRPGQWVVVITLAVVAATLFTLRARVGFELTGEAIQERLGGRHETEHFVIFYPEGTAVARRIERLALDHEFRHHQLSETLGVAPQAKIHSYIYADSAQKQTLMGAGRTYIAKPWSREIHLNAVELGAPVLKHELAHVFGAEIAGGPFGIPTQWLVMPRMALVEGFAVGLTGPKGRLTPHQWSAAMQELGIAPPIDRILGAGGFLGAPSGQAYTLSGSLMRWLLDEYGLDRFRVLYSTGDLAAAYDEPPLDLLERWEAFLADRERVPLSEDDLRLARFHFDAPSKFHRVCALEIARWESEADAAHVAGDTERALALRERVVGHDPDNPNKRWHLMNALIAHRELDRALRAAGELSGLPTTSRVLAAQTRGRMGDIQWLQGDRAAAVQTYRSLLSEPLDEAARRRWFVSARAAAWDDVARGDAVRNYLLRGASNHDAAIATLLELTDAAPEEPLGHYLLGRRYFAAERWDEADASLARSLDLGLGARDLEREAHRQRGVLRIIDRRAGDAEPHFRAALVLHDSLGHRSRLEDWIERSRWQDVLDDQK